MNPLILNKNIYCDKLELLSKIAKSLRHCILLSSPHLIWRFDYFDDAKKKKKGDI